MHDRSVCSRQPREGVVLISANSKTIDTKYKAVVCPKKHSAAFFEYGGPFVPYIIFYQSCKLASVFSYHEHRRCFMNTKTVNVHCSYSEDGKDIAEILLESFRLFLKKELLSLDIRKGL